MKFCRDRENPKQPSHIQQHCSLSKCNFSVPEPAITISRSSIKHARAQKALNALDRRLSSRFKVGSLGNPANVCTAVSRVYLCH